MYLLINCLITFFEFFTFFKNLKINFIIIYKCYVSNHFYFNNKNIHGSHEAFFTLRNLFFFLIKIKKSFQKLSNHTYSIFCK